MMHDVKYMVPYVYKRKIVKAWFMIFKLNQGL